MASRSSRRSLGNEHGQHIHRACVGRRADQLSPSPFTLHANGRWMMLERRLVLTGVPPCSTYCAGGVMWLKGSARGDAEDQDTVGASALRQRPHRPSSAHRMHGERHPALGRTRCRPLAPVATPLVQRVTVAERGPLRESRPGVLRELHSGPRPSPRGRAGRVRGRRRDHAAALDLRRGANQAAGGRRRAHVLPPAVVPLLRRAPTNHLPCEPGREGEVRCGV
jgi:hypothetical protein